MGDRDDQQDNEHEGVSILAGENHQNVERSFPPENNCQHSYDGRVVHRLVDSERESRHVHQVDVEIDLEVGFLIIYLSRIIPEDVTSIRVPLSHVSVLSDGCCRLAPSVTRSIRHPSSLTHQLSQLLSLLQLCVVLKCFDPDPLVQQVCQDGIEIKPHETHDQNSSVGFEPGEISRVKQGPWSKPYKVDEHQVKHYQMHFVRVMAEVDPNPPHGAVIKHKSLHQL